MIVYIIINEVIAMTKLSRGLRIQLIQAKSNSLHLALHQIVV